ncbi:MAG: hypothetical protein KC474_07230 [Cyanobacteria bacterium HKST-UBA04]|nr:hypothetical protein [Cyanobacteria bacterium HKST-UBA04]MCA9841758.1 hypothetical protein [Cyanobacteria bacterium HKST-UBA03]
MKPGKLYHYARVPDTFLGPHVSFAWLDRTTTRHGSQWAISPLCQGLCVAFVLAVVGVFVGVIYHVPEWPAWAPSQTPDALVMALIATVGAVGLWQWPRLSSRITLNMTEDCMVLTSGSGEQTRIAREAIQSMDIHAGMVNVDEDSSFWFYYVVLCASGRDPMPLVGSPKQRDIERFMTDVAHWGGVEVRDFASDKLNRRFSLGKLMRMVTGQPAEERASWHGR